MALESVKLPLAKLGVAAFALQSLWAQGGPTCSCGANPPGPPPNREARPYAGAPADMRPFAKFTEPYYEHYTRLVEYNGAARESRTVLPSEVSEVRIGFLGPVENHPDEHLGKLMLNGAVMAIEEANARGGYGGKPFKLVIRNDQAIWGAASNEIVKLTYDDQVWAIHGSISGDTTHIALRASLKTEVPIVNSAATDPTIPETIIPWYLSTLQDDRVQCYTLARRIYSDLGLKRVALLRINDRYGRFGVGKFKDASRRLGRPVVIEQKFLPQDTDFTRQLRIIGETGADAIVIWGDARQAALILKQMRQAGMKQRVFGSFRVLGDDLLPVAGPAAEGLEAVFPYDPTRDDPTWLDFNSRFEKRYGRRPEAFSSLAFDTMNILLTAICNAGLNRGKIRDALTAVEHYKGVTGQMSFDPNCKNILPLYLATVKNGRLTFRRYPMQAPYARVGGDGVSYNGPANDAQARQAIAIFGPGAAPQPSLPGGGFALHPVSSELPWGAASSKLVSLIYDEKVLAIIAGGRNAAHLASQLAAKARVPVIAISADRDLTSVNLPWLFRLPPGTNIEDAVRLLHDAVSRGGSERDSIRRTLASGVLLAGQYQFDSRGEPLN